MPSESEIHDLLARFGRNIIDLLDSIDFFDIEGEYNPVELIAELERRPEYKRYVAESQKKNSQVWDIVKGIFVGTAILAGISQVKRDYKPQLARQVAKESSQPKADRPKHPTSQDYQNQYIREHGGEFIKNMSRTDQKKLVQFIWSNKNEHERPLAKVINQQPNLRYILDQGTHRTETIIRTEKARATRYGAMNYAKDWGAETKTWHTAGDGRVRPSHRALSGMEIPISDKFPNEGEFPGSVSINCRCFLTYNF